MTKRNTSKKPTRPREQGSARLSITVPAADYAGIRTAAERKRVSIAWVVRDAVHRYLRGEETR